MNLPNGTILEYFRSYIMKMAQFPLTRLSSNFYAVVNKRQFNSEGPLMVVSLSLFFFLSFGHVIL